MASTTTAGLPEMLMEMGDVFHPVAELIRMPSDMQFMTLVNYPQSLILIRNSVMLLTQAGFSLHNLQEMGVAAEVLLACIQTGMPTPAIDPSFSAPVPVVSEPDTESSHIADSSFEDKAIVEEMSVPLSMSPPPGEPEDRPPVADETELFSEKELVHSPVSCAESKHSQHEDEKVEDVDMANVLPSPVLSDMELDNDPNLIFTITAAKLLERSKRGQSQILGKTPPLEDLRTQFFVSKSY
ncbi:hypothetical protein BC829DRAFT_83936 [Chytridium lagenaria]|nr:hypothetical protein BC829DRAFT_83936 [Chytridium lagenaria]